MTESVKQSSKKHWLIYLACCVIMFLTLGMMQNSPGVFVVTVSESLGVGRGPFSVYLTIQNIGMMVGLTVAGKILQTFNTKIIMAIFSVTASVAFGAMGFYTILPMFYVSGAIIGFSVAFCGFMTVNVLINNWFAKRVGFLMGLASAIASVGGITFNTVNAMLIQNIGWQTAYMIEGALALVLVTGSVLLFVRFKPEDVGLKPWGYDAEEAAAAALMKDTEVPGVKASTAFRSPAYYLFFIFAIGGTFVSAFNMNVPGYVDSLGYDLTFAGLMASIVLAGAAIGKILLGVLNDRLGHLAAQTIFIASGFVGFIIMIFAGYNPPVFIVGAVFFGFAFALSTVSPPIVARKLFGSKDYATLYSIVTIGTMSSGAVAVPLMGYIFDFTGSYVSGIWITIGVMLFALLCLYLATSIAKKLPGSPLGVIRK